MEVCRRGRMVCEGQQRGRYEQLPCAASPVASPSSCALHWPPTLCSIDECQYGSSHAIEAITYPFNDLLDSLLVALHLQESLNLRQREVFPIAQCHQLIECAQQLEGIAGNLPFVQALANAGGHLSKQVQAINVLEDVGLAVGDQDDVQFIQWLVHEADVVLFDSGVLSSGIRKLGERGEQGLNARPSNFAELAREDRFTSASAYRRCEDNLVVGRLR